MTDETWPEAARMLRSFGVVAAGVVPLTMALAWVNRRLREPVLPRRAAWPVPWNGFDVAFLAVAVVAGLPALAFELVGSAGLFEAVYGTAPPALGHAARLNAAAAIAGEAVVAAERERVAGLLSARGLWAGVLALPLQLAAVWLLRTSLYPTRPVGGRLPLRAVPARLVLVGRAWLVLTPAVFAVHFLTVYVCGLLGSPPDDHPLTKVSPNRPALDRLLLVLQACVAAPLAEEVLCRGILLPWAGRRAYRSWLVLAASAALVLLSGGRSGTAVSRYGALLFAAATVAVWALVEIQTRSRRAEVIRRRFGGVYASSVFFAALHAAIWPSPVPLLFLGLGLGGLAVATRGVFVPVVVHGLFNAVSAVFVLNGS